MQNLVACGTAPQYKPSLKIRSNYMYLPKKYQINCSAGLRVAPNAKVEEECAKAGLRKELIPEHVAIILDGSRRWLKARGKPLTYEPFFQSNTLFADLCLKYGVTTATTFIYSIKNLERRPEANELFFGQLKQYLENNMEDFIRKDIKVSMVGDRSLLPNSLRNTMKQVEDETAKYTRQLEFNLAFCYSGRRDIVEAARNISEKVKAGVIEPKSINEDLIDQELWTRGIPQPELLIRTGNRVRISDYLVWQSALSELFFSELSAPEFREEEFVKALRSYQERERTYGL